MLNKFNQVESFHENVPDINAKLFSMLTFYFVVLVRQQTEQ